MPAIATEFWQMQSLFDAPAGDAVQYDDVGADWRGPWQRVPAAMKKSPEDLASGVFLPSGSLLYRRLELPHAQVHSGSGALMMMIRVRYLGQGGNCWLVLDDVAANREPTFDYKNNPLAVGTWRRGGRYYMAVGGSDRTQPARLHDGVYSFRITLRREADRWQATSLFLSGDGHELHRMEQSLPLDGLDLSTCRTLVIANQHGGDMLVHDVTIQVTPLSRDEQDGGQAASSNQGELASPHQDPARARPGSPSGPRTRSGDGNPESGRPVPEPREHPGPAPVLVPEPQPDPPATDRDTPREHRGDTAAPGMAVQDGHGWLWALGLGTVLVVTVVVALVVRQTMRADRDYFTTLVHDEKQPDAGRRSTAPGRRGTGRRTGSRGRPDR